MSVQAATMPEQPAPQLNIAPFQPSVPLLSSTSTSELETYWPISRRFMAYMWRYLRRPASTGMRDVLDLNATIDEAARTGLLLEPIYLSWLRVSSGSIAHTDNTGSQDRG
jgi:hypothetical protein